VSSNGWWESKNSCNPGGKLLLSGEPGIECGGIIRIRERSTPHFSKNSTISWLTATTASNCRSTNARQDRLCMARPSGDDG